MLVSFTAKSWDALPVVSQHAGSTLTFFGHQLVAHQVDASQLDAPDTDGATNKVEGHDVPASHFGIVLAWEDYRSLLPRLTDAGIEFAIDHHVRFGGRPGEQATFFVQDPSGNYLEFKTFRNIEMLFAKDLVFPHQKPIALLIS